MLLLFLLFSCWDKDPQVCPDCSLCEECVFPGTGRSLSLDQGTTEFWDTSGGGSRLAGVAYATRDTVDTSISYEYKLLVSDAGTSTRTVEYPALVPLVSGNSSGRIPTPINLTHFKPKQNNNPFGNLATFVKGAWEHLDDNEGKLVEALWVKSIIKWYDVCDVSKFKAYASTVTEQGTASKWVDMLDQGGVVSAYGESADANGDRYIHQKHTDGQLIAANNPLQVGAKNYQWDLPKWLGESPMGDSVVYTKAWVLGPMTVSATTHLDIRPVSWPGGVIGNSEGVKDFSGVDKKGGCL